MKPEDRLGEAYKQLTITALDEDLTEVQQQAAENLAGIVEALALSIEAVRELAVDEDDEHPITDGGERLEHYEDDPEEVSLPAVRALSRRLDELDDRVEHRTKTLEDMVAAYHDLEQRLERVETEVFEEIGEIEEVDR